MLALIFGFTSIAVFAEDARQLTCSGMMIEPNAMSQSPETVMLTLGPAQKVTLDLGQGVVNARRVSDNKIQLKFRTKDFEGEYFHYTGDLFFIYKSGHLMKLTCQKREIAWPCRVLRRPTSLAFCLSDADRDRRQAQKVE
jgi:hypothetical protein